MRDANGELWISLHSIEWTSTLRYVLSFVQVTVTRILHTRNAGVETWFTSDGRAYFVQLEETSHSEAGTSDLGYAEDGEQACNLPKCLLILIRDLRLRTMEVIPEADLRRIHMLRTFNFTGKGHASTISTCQSGFKNSGRSNLTAFKDRGPTMTHARP
jgi:hypothetical protein